MFYSTKKFSGYSTCFRQHAASHSHCRFLHGYALEFKVVFAGKLDNKNWVCDFGGFKKNGVKDKLDFYFDHTTVVAIDDPEIETFKLMQKIGLLQLRILPAVGAEKFAQFVSNMINKILSEDHHTKNRVFVKSVECFEHRNNSALYSDEKILRMLEKENNYEKDAVLERFSALDMSKSFARS